MFSTSNNTVKSTAIFKGTVPHPFGSQMTVFAAHDKNKALGKTQGNNQTSVSPPATKNQASNPANMSQNINKINNNMFNQGNQGGNKPLFGNNQQQSTPSSGNNIFGNNANQGGTGSAPAANIFGNQGSSNNTNTLFAKTNNPQGGNQGTGLTSVNSFGSINTNQTQQQSSPFGGNKTATTTGTPNLFAKGTATTPTNSTNNLFPGNPSSATTGGAQQPVANKLFQQKQPAKPQLANNNAPLFTNAQKAQTQATNTNAIFPSSQGQGTNTNAIFNNPQQSQQTQNTTVNAPNNLFNNQNQGQSLGQGQAQAQAQTTTTSATPALFSNNAASGSTTVNAGLVQNSNTNQKKDQTSGTISNNLFSNNNTSQQTSSANSAQTPVQSPNLNLNQNKTSSPQNQTTEQNVIEKLSAQYQRSNDTFAQYLQKWKKLEASCLQQIAAQSQFAKSMLEDRLQNFKINQNFQKLAPVLVNSKQAINANLQRIQKEQLHLITILNRITQQIDNEINPRFIRQSPMASHIRGCQQIQKQIDEEEAKLAIMDDHIDLNIEQMKNVFFNLDIVQNQIRRMSHVIEHYFGREVSN